MVRGDVLRLVLIVGLILLAITCGTQLVDNLSEGARYGN